MISTAVATLFRSPFALAFRYAHRQRPAPSTTAPATRPAGALVPQAARAKKVQLLVSGQTPRVEGAAGYVTLTVPSILYHEVVAVEV